MTSRAAVRKISKSVRYWQKKGVAPGWHIDYFPAPGLNSILATTWSPGYRWANIKINTGSEYLNGAEKLIKRCVLHELVHLHIATIHDWVDLNFEDDGPIGRDVANRMETVVDATTNLIWNLSEGEF